MKRFSWVNRFAGATWSVAEQAAAQPSEPISLPATVPLEGVTLRLRYLEAGDGPGLIDFARRLSPHDLLFLRRDITRQEQVDQWLHESAAGLTTTIIALDGDKIVGYAAVTSDGLAWTRHVLELDVMVAESMRGKHLGRLLTEQAFAVAQERGANKMVARMTVDQHAANNVFRRMGFEPEARLKRQVMDRDGQLHDLQIMALDVGAFRAKLAALMMQPPPF
jgi:L-amino acid N-acyltransferase YncA